MRILRRRSIAGLGRLGRVAGLTGLLAAACAPPDGPDALVMTIPPAVLDLLAPDTARSAALAPGVAYRYLWSPRGPWAVHLVQARIADRCDLGFSVLLPAARVSGGRGRATVTAMVGASSHDVLAAVNADFFTAEGTTVGTEVVQGAVRRATDRPTFAWRRDREPWMGSSAPEGGGVRLGWTVPAVGDDVTEAVGGFPDMIDEGRRVGDLEVARRPTFAAARHPRTAVGYDVDSGIVWIVVVDGRQMPHSAGMSLPELASLFEALGAEEAVNLDGGGSSALVVGEGPVNRPSDATGERAVVNALALVRDADGCR